MAYDPELAERIRTLLTGVPSLTEKKMFGGIGWTINGNMATGAHNDGRLMIRCAKEDFERLLAEPGAEGMKKGSRNLTGWILVDPAVVEDQASLIQWVGIGRGFAEQLPGKTR